ncbi:MAG TPA: PaaI family thioesterase [Longimicrobiaceae bacterium]|nr:PaaI family thioesterase [Longimicrobiaceae bacterium]
METESETPERFHPRDPDYDARVRASFARQAFMATLGARLAAVEPGRVEIELPFRADLAQQHGFLHAGAATAVVDSACGYAALTLMPPAAAVLSVEFKVNLLAPGAGARFRAVGRVVRAGRTLTVCSGELVALRDEPDGGVVVAMMQATMIAVREREGLSD